MENTCLSVVREWFAFGWTLAVDLCLESNRSHRYGQKTIDILENRSTERFRSVFVDFRPEKDNRRLSSARLQNQFQFNFSESSWPQMTSS